MYTTASGVQIPQGTDSFSPATQFKNWADKAAMYENRVVVASDAARNALASPERREGLLCYVEATDTTWIYENSGWKVIDRPAHIQIDTTNSTGRVEFIPGKGKILGTGAATVSKAVTFPVAFASVPHVIVTSQGGRAPGAFNDAALPIGAIYGVAHNKSTTGFSAGLVAHGGTIPAGTEWYYDWIAIGVPA